MYRHTHSFLATAAIAGGGLHFTGFNLLWTAVLAATLTGAGISLAHIGLGLGLPHPRQLAAALRRRRSNTTTPSNTDWDTPAAYDPAN